MSKDRLVNFRSFVVTAIFVICAVFSALICCNNFFGIMILLGEGALSILLFFRFYANKIVRLTAIFSFVLAFITFVVFFAFKNYWRTPQMDFDKEISVKGKVDSYSDTDGEFYLILSDLTFGGKKVNGKLSVYVPDGIYASVGDNVSLTASVTANELVSGFKVDSSVAVKGIKYTANVFSDFITVTKGSPDLRQKIRLFIREKLSVMGKTSEIAYAMITGDRNTLDADMENGYRLSGLSHILAVSGLHVGFLMFLLSFILKKFRVSKICNMIVNLVVLGSYVLFVSSATVLRAGIMTAIGLFTYINGRRKDILNTLCIAISVIVTIMPFHLFDIGFVMSIGAVLGIALFGGSLSRLFERFKLPLKSMIPPVISAQIGVMPCLIYYFGNINIFSIFLNLLLMPVISFVFPLTIVLFLVSTVIPFADVLLKIPASLYSLVGAVTDLTYRLSINNLIIFAGSEIFMLYPLYFMCSEYFRKSFVKGVGIVLPAVLLAVFVLITPIGMRNKEYIIPLKDDYRVATVVKGRSNMYIGDLLSLSVMENYFKKYDVRGVDEFYLYSLSQSDLLKLERLRVKYNSFKVYVDLPSNVDVSYRQKLKEYGIKSFGADEGTLCPYYSRTIFGDIILSGYGWKEKRFMFLDKGILYDDEMSSEYKYIRCFEAGEYINSVLFVNSGTDKEKFIYDVGWLYDIKNDAVLKGKI